MSHAGAGPAIKDSADAVREMQQPSMSPRVAHIVSVTGAQAVAILERSAFPGGGQPPVRVEIGATMAIPTPHATVVGLVSAVSVPMPDAAAGQDGRARPGSVEPLGRRPAFPQFRQVR